MLVSSDCCLITLPLQAVLAVFHRLGWDLGEELGVGGRESLKVDIGCPALGKELAGLGHLRVQCSNLERPSHSPQ